MDGNRKIIIPMLIVVAGILAVSGFYIRQPGGTLLLTPDQKAYRLYMSGREAEAAERFADPLWKGVALFKAGRFKKAGDLFSGIDSSISAYNHGNALVMQGRYEEAVRRYDRALEREPEWEAASVNRDIAIARAKAIEKHGGEMTGGQLEADEIVYSKGKTPPSEDDPTAGHPIDGRYRIEGHVVEARANQTGGISCAPSLPISMPRGQRVSNESIPMIRRKQGGPMDRFLRIALLAVLAIFTPSVAPMICAAQRADPVILRTSVVPAEAWVGQRVLFHIDVLVEGGWAQIRKIGDVDVPGAHVMQTETQGTRISETIDGSAYTGQRYTLSIFPQREGAVEIPAFPVAAVVKTWGAGAKEQVYPKTTPEIQFASKLPADAKKLSGLISTPRFDGQSTMGA